MVIFSLPCGITSAIACGLAFITVTHLYHSGAVPLCRCIAVGVAIVIFGLWMDARFGIIE